MRRALKGKGTWGRVNSQVSGTVSARVQRADSDEWEDLGTVGSFGKEQ